MDLSPDSPIVFFDSHCLLCNGSIQFILKNEKKHGLLFAPFGGKIYEKYIGITPPETIPETIIVFDNHQICFYSRAIIVILTNMGSYWYYLGIFAKIFPSSLLDYFYKIIAKNRYKWFGKTDSCMLPTKETKLRFLD